VSYSSSSPYDVSTNTTAGDTCEIHSEIRSEIHSEIHITLVSRNLTQVSFKMMESLYHITITQCYFKYIAQVQTISPYHSVQIHIPDIYHRFSKCLYSSPHCTFRLVCPLFTAPLHSSNRSALFVHRVTFLSWILYFCGSIFTGNVTFTFLVV